MAIVKFWVSRFPRIAVETVFIALGLTTIEGVVDARHVANAAEMTSTPGAFVVWSFGTGNTGVRDGELSGPHSAEENPFDPNEIVVAEQYGCDVLLINRRTSATKVLFGERGVPGSDEKRINAAHSAHFLPTGPYAGQVVVTEYKGDHRVMIIAQDTGKILWSYDGLSAPLDAIYWDDEHLMASDRDHGVFKIHLARKSKEWSYDTTPHSNPFYLQKIDKHHFASYGGDLLIGYYGPPSQMVRELDTDTKQTVWSYGGSPPEGSGDLWNRLYTPVRAFRYGISENGGGLTIIVDERSRILCVNREKELVWELGGASASQLRPATEHLILPTYVSVTRRGTLLITYWGRNMVYEASPFAVPKRLTKDAYLFRSRQTPDRFTDSAIVESRGYRQKLVQVYNRYEAHALDWQVLGSHDAQTWQAIEQGPRRLEPNAGGHQTVNGPWSFLRVQARSADAGKPAEVDAYVSMSR
jgi:hypothetical protein